MRTISSAVQRLVLAVLVGLVIVGAAHGAIMIAFDIYGRISESLLLTTGLLILCFAVVLASVAARRRGRMRTASLAAIVFMLIGTFMLCGLIWFESQLQAVVTEEFIARTATTLLGTAIVIAHTGMFQLIEARSRAVIALKWTTSVAMCLLLAAVLALAWLGESISDFSVLIALAVTIMAIGVLALAGTIVTPLAALSRANRRERPAESIAARVKVKLGCPTCGHRQELRTGHVRCASCGAGLFVEVEEPRCECGYLLYRLVGDACPECGRQIEARPAVA